MCKKAADSKLRGRLGIAPSASCIIQANRWYIAERTEDGGVVCDVTGRQREIYDALAQPYQTIEDETMRNKSEES